MVKILQTQKQKQQIISIFPIFLHKTLKLDDINIGYKKIGTGPSILLITGFSASMNNWNPTLINNLSKNHTVIIFDNRGIGEYD